MQKIDDNKSATARLIKKLFRSVLARPPKPSTQITRALPSTDKMIVVEYTSLMRNWAYVDCTP